MDPPRTTESAIISKALSMIGKILLSYGPSILFLQDTSFSADCDSRRQPHTGNKNAYCNMLLRNRKL